MCQVQRRRVSRRAGYGSCQEGESPPVLCEGCNAYLFLYFLFSVLYLRNRTFISLLLVDPFTCALRFRYPPDVDDVYPAALGHSVNHRRSTTSFA